MQDKNLTYEQEQDVESHASMYLKVWGALLVLTVLEYSYASLVNASYRPGVLVVAGTLLVGAAISLAMFGVNPPPPRAALDLGAKPIALGAFQLTERSGRTVTQADLADRVWIASFIFTRCRA